MSDLLAHVLVPVATEEDARATAQSLSAIAPARITVVHVVEKAGGAPDKTGVEQSEHEAEMAFDVVRETFPEAETELRYDTDVVDGIVETARETGASAIVFRPREGGRLSRLLTGDLSLSLITQTDRPVIVLPSTDE